MSLIWTPEHPLFYEVLHTAKPPEPGGVGLVRDGSGVVDWVDPESAQFQDYLYGGEYDQVMAGYGDNDDELNYP
jgi:hypothetical protein